MAKLRHIIKYLKHNDINLYNEYKHCISDYVVLVNKLVAHYQWLFEITNFSTLDLQNRYNKNYLNLFMYAMENNEELVNNFINYFVFSFRTAFDFNTKQWNLDLIFNIFIHQCSKREFDLLAMYVLMAATYNRFIKFILNVKVDNKLNMNASNILDLFDLIVDQNFYDELKLEVFNKRKNSFYHKEPDIEIHLPKQESKTMKREIDILKKAQSVSEAEFKKWDELIAEQHNDSLLDNQIDDDTNESIQAQTNDFSHTIDSIEDIELDDLDSSPSVIVNNDEVKNKFAPRPDIKIIKLKAHSL